MKLEWSKWGFRHHL